MSQLQLAEEIGVSPSSISLWESESVSPEADKIVLLANFFDVSTDYILGNSNFVKPKSIITQTSLLNIDKIVSIPVFDKLSIDEEGGVDFNTIDTLEVILSSEISENDYFALMVKDNLMEPTIHSGDFLLCQKTSDCKNGDLVILAAETEYAIVRKLLKKNNSIILTSFNPDVEPLYYSEEEILKKKIKFIAKVVELRRRY